MNKTFTFFFIMPLKLFLVQINERLIDSKITKESIMNKA